MYNQTKTTSTEEAYSTRAKGLILRYEKKANVPWQENIDDFITWLSDTIRPTLKKASWRQYKASLVHYMLEQEVPETTIGRIKDIDTSTCKKKSRATSAAKEKKISNDDMTELADVLLKSQSKWDDLIYKWMQAGIITGLRPVEWLNCELDGNKLIVKNAKHTNQRSFGPTRILDLSNLNEDQYDIIDTFLSKLELAIMSNTSFDAVYQACRFRLRRVTRKLWPKRRKYPTLYTGRHQFSANSKNLFSKAEVSAMMGHLSEDTATMHYGKKVHGERLPSFVIPNPDQVKLVKPGKKSRIKEDSPTSKAQ